MEAAVAEERAAAADPSEENASLLPVTTATCVAGSQVR